MNTMASLAFAFPLTPGKADELRSWGAEILGRGDPGAAPKRIPCIPPPPGSHRATRVPPTNTASGYSDHIRGGGRSPAHVQGSADIAGPVCCLVSATGKRPPRRSRPDTGLTGIAVQTCL